MLATISGRRMSYDDLGAESGETVCFLHSLASDGGMWAEQVPPLLARGYRVLRIDLRGHGGSEPGEGDATIDDLAGDVLAILDRLPVARLHLVGLSIGGIVAQAIAVTHPARLTSLMLCDTACATPDAWREVWPARMKIVREAGSVEPLANSTIERWFTEAFRAGHPQRWSAIRATIAGTSPRGYLGAAAALLDFDFSGKLPSLALPALVVCGSDDQGTPPEINRRIAGLIPGARYEEIANARHMPNVEHAETFNRMLMAWLCRVQ
jgi:3-oxoadipate enol-lactonase